MKNEIGIKPGVLFLPHQETGLSVLKISEKFFLVTTFLLFYG